LISSRANSGGGIFEKSLKRFTIEFRLASSAFSVAVDSLNTSRNCSWTQLPRALHVFYRNLQRKQRIAQLMRQTPRQFTPSRNTLRLH
jgi:hypothetical protein